MTIPTAFFFFYVGAHSSKQECYLSQKIAIWLLLEILIFGNPQKLELEIYLFIFSSAWLHAMSLQSCLTLWDPMYYSPKGSSVHGIFQARILEWIAIPSSKGSYQPRGQTCDSTTLPATLPPSPPGNSYGSTIDLQKDIHLLYTYWLAWMYAYTQDTIRLPKWLSGKDSTCQCTPGYFTYSSPPKFFLWFFVSF